MLGGSGGGGGAVLCCSQVCSVRLEGSGVELSGFGVSVNPQGHAHSLTFYTTMDYGLSSIPFMLSGYFHDDNGFWIIGPEYGGIRVEHPKNRKCKKP